MADAILIQRFQAQSKALLKMSWQALARLIPSLEHAGLHFFYRVDPKLAFPAREIQAFNIQHNQVELSLNFMGLQGVSTPLPTHYSELIIQDDPDESNLNEFYNFFNQQFFRHLLAIQHKYAYLPQLQSDVQDPLSLNLLSFAGLHPQLFVEKEDYFKMLPFLPLLLGRQLSQSAWSQLIQQVFDCKQVWLKQWVPLKMQIPRHARNNLGTNICLGQNGSLGEYVTHAKNHVELHLRILYLKGFLPHESQFQALQRILQWITPTPTQFTIVLHIEQGNAMHLTKNLGLYLGWNSLLTQHHNPNMEIMLSGG